MMDVVGFALIDKNATTGKGATNDENFKGEICRVLEFDKFGGALVVDNKAENMAMFDSKDIVRKFECGFVNGVVTPPNLNPIEQMIYVFEATNRKGGYNHIVAHIVIASSLKNQKFNDHVLWDKQ